MSEPERGDESRRIREELERLLAMPTKLIPKAVIVPAWRQLTEGEPVWPERVAIAIAIGLEISLPNKYEIPPPWLLPVLGILLEVGLSVANPRRITKHTPQLRLLSILLIAIISLANAGSAARLITALLRGTAHESPTRLLLTGGAIWLANVIVFGTWYWNLDRGGPGARFHGVKQYPDFLFPQMQSPDLSPPEWRPQFVDYLYLSFTNAAAFSPTDVLPLARWAKMTMMLQSIVSLATIALVIARAVNILGG